MAFFSRTPKLALHDDDRDVVVGTLGHGEADELLAGALRRGAPLEDVPELPGADRVHAVGAEQDDVPRHQLQAHPRLEDLVRRPQEAGQVRLVVQHLLFRQLLLERVLHPGVVAGEADERLLAEEVHAGVAEVGDVEARAHTRAHQHRRRHALERRVGLLGDAHGPGGAGEGRPLPLLWARAAVAVGPELLERGRDAGAGDVAAGVAAHPVGDDAEAVVVDEVGVLVRLAVPAVVAADLGGARHVEARRPAAQVHEPDDGARVERRLERLAAADPGLGGGAPAGDVAARVAVQQVRLLGRLVAGRAGQRRRVVGLPGGGEELVRLRLARGVVGHVGSPARLVRRLARVHHRRQLVLVTHRISPLDVTWSHRPATRWAEPKTPCFHLVPIIYRRHIGFLNPGGCF